MVNKKLYEMSSIFSVDIQCPDGLEEMLESLTREVLRHQPPEIFSFAATHFEKLLHERGKLNIPSCILYNLSIYNKLKLGWGQP